MSQKTPRPLFQVSVDTQLLFDRLVKAEPGETVTYSELSALVGGDVQSDKSGNLHSARRMAMQQHRMVFDAIRNVGIIRLKDADIVGTGSQTVAKLRSVAKRGAKRMLCVQEYETLPGPLKIKHNMFASLFGATLQFTGDQSIKRVEKRVEQTASKITLEQTLEAFRKG